MSPYSAWRQGSLQANGIRFHFYFVKPDEGRRLPKLVYLHGLSHTGSLFIPLLQNFVDEYELYLPDLRGCGKSQPIPKGSFTMPNLVSDALALIRHFSTDGPVFLIGHSMGAAIAARVAQFHPEVVRGLVLEDPPWFRLPGEPVNPAERSVLGLLDHCRSLKLLSEEEIKAREGSEAVELPAVSRPRAQRSFDVDNVEPTFQDTDDEINEAVVSIQVPTLLMTGEAQCGSRCKASVVEAVLPTWPRAKVAHFPGGSHLLFKDAPRWTAETKAFFKSLL